VGIILKLLQLFIQHIDFINNLLIHHLAIMLGGGDFGMAQNINI